MIRIAICMETENYGKAVRDTVLEWAVQRQYNIQPRVFMTGEEVLADIEQSGYYDIVLMDMELKGKRNGMDTARQIRQIYQYFCLIFLSKQENYCNEIFRLHPFEYLEKPVRKRWLTESLSQAVESYHLMYETFAFRFRGRAYCIRLSEVLYFASDKRVIRIYMESGREYVFYEKLDELERKMEKYTSRFFRVHQSYLINGGQVEQCHTKYIIMRNREIIPVSVDRREKAGEIGIKNYK
ncbi:MAG: LytR/AlgR family response regulator transcription factor [Suilimivivens sp.]